MSAVEFNQIVDDIVTSAVRLDNDINGNPRYYVSVCAFIRDGEFMRPFNASKYRGKRYGAGWVFQSYNLKSSIEHAVSSIYKGLNND